MDLMSFVRGTMFDSVVRQLFGRENVPQTEDKMRELEKKFFKFDEDFEYGTQLPEVLIRCSASGHDVCVVCYYSRAVGSGGTASTGCCRCSRKWWMM